ncbi:MAG: HlyD family efflux transporter periplasmic adaptor subunit [Planctomycetota bacterium]
MIRWISILIAAVGLCVAVAAITPTLPTPPDLAPVRMPSVNPFADGIASLGQVEPASREVGISAPVPGLVVEVLVDVGQLVAAGDVLFRLDDRELRAELVRVLSGIAVKQAVIDRWYALPREEDLPPLRAAAARARAEAADRQDELDRVTEAVKERARSERDATAARSALEQALSRATQADSDLARAVAGGWKPDLAVATAELEQQRALVSALEIQLDRLVVRAPKAGTILRRQIEPGEYATPGGATPLVVLGDLSSLRVRAQIDEEDIAQVTPGVLSVGRTRGVVVEEFELTLVRIEPYARGKTQLSGSNSDRVDTRVVEVVFAVEKRPKSPIYPGQAIDVYVGKIRSK